MTRVLIAFALAAPLLAVATHAPLPASASDGRPAAALPTNLCASCHGAGRRAAALAEARLGDADLAAAGRYLAAASPPAELSPAR